jgi:hypothetical protein
VLACAPPSFRFLLLPCSVPVAGRRHARVCWWQHLTEEALAPTPPSLSALVNQSPLDDWPRWRSSTRLDADDPAQEPPRHGGAMCARPLLDGAASFSIFSVMPSSQMQRGTGRPNHPAGVGVDV